MQNSLKSLLLCLRNGALGTFSLGRETMETRYSSSMPLTPIPLILLPKKIYDFNFASLLGRDFYRHPSSVLALLTTIFPG